MRRFGLLRSLSIITALGACETQFIDPMEHQKKYLPYSENLLYPDERAMRPLPAGSVSRERLLGNPALTVGAPPSDGDDDFIAVPRTASLLATGKTEYFIRCAPCHGLVGDGLSVVARKMSRRPPPSLIEGPITQYPAGHYYRVITQGYGLMPSYAAELSVEGRWAVVAYLRALQLSQNAPLELAPPQTRELLNQEAP